MTTAHDTTGRTLFTPLHRWLGHEAEPLTLALVDEAVTMSLEERADLDFKASPPSSSALAQSDLAKDIAAMANSGGGMLLFGVRDNDSRACEAPGISADFVTDTYLRDLRRVAINRISPPVLDLALEAMQDGDRCALGVVVPASMSAPHLIYNNDNFKAPYRNGPDTAWMDERMLEAAYRTRFEGHKARDTTLNQLVELGLDGRDITQRAWMVAVGRSSNPSRTRRRLERSEAAATFDTAYSKSSGWITHHVQPLDWLDRSNPRPGLRSWKARFSRDSDSTRWREAEAEIGDDGSILLASAMGGGRSGAVSSFNANEIPTDRAETFLSDFFALLRCSADLTGVRVFDIEVDVRWDGPDPMMFRIPDRTVGDYYLDPEYSMPIHRFRPVRVVVDASTAEAVFNDQLREVALDVVNQGGAQFLHSIKDPASQPEESHA